VQLETLGLAQVGDAEKDLSALEVKLHIIQVPAGELDDIHLGEPAHPQEVLLPEMDLETSFPCAQRVAAYYRQVDAAGFIAQILRPLHIGVSTDIAHPGIAVVIICVVLSGGPGKEQN
jgi:hypothetical protein